VQVFVLLGLVLYEQQKTVEDSVMCVRFMEGNAGDVEVGNGSSVRNQYQFREPDNVELRVKRRFYTSFRKFCLEEDLLFSMKIRSLLMVLMKSRCAGWNGPKVIL